MTNPIALLIRPGRAILLGLALFAGYGVLLEIAAEVPTCPSIITDAELTRVELLE